MCALQTPFAVLKHLVDVLREANTSHLEDGLVLGLDALQETRLGEGKLCGGSLQVVVGLCLRHPFHKLRQVALQANNRTSVSVMPMRSGHRAACMIHTYEHQGASMRKLIELAVIATLTLKPKPIKMSRNIHKIAIPAVQRIVCNQEERRGVHQQKAMELVHTL